MSRGWPTEPVTSKLQAPSRAARLRERRVGEPLERPASRSSPRTRPSPCTFAFPKMGANCMPRLHDEVEPVGARPRRRRPSPRASRTSPSRRRASPPRRARRGRCAGARGRRAIAGHRELPAGDAGVLATRDVDAAAWAFASGAAGTGAGPPCRRASRARSTPDAFRSGSARARSTPSTVERRRAARRRRGRRCRARGRRRARASNATLRRPTSSGRSRSDAVSSSIGIASPEASSSLTPAGAHAEEPARRHVRRRRSASRARPPRG